MTEKKTRLQEFEALRALAIILLMVVHSEVLGLSVFGYHLGPSANYLSTFLLGCFFFLSGYFEEPTLQKYSGNIWSLVKSRFLRIYPPYWLALYLFVEVLGFTLRRFNLWVYLFNLQFIFSPAFAKQLLTLWYISMFVSYYTIFGVLIFRTNTNLQLLAWSVLLFSAAYILHRLTKLLDPRFFQYFFIFLAGIYFSRLEQRRVWLLNLHFLYKAGFAVLGLLLFGLAKYEEFEMVNGLRIFAVNFYMLGWILLWLGIFRTSLGSWRIWSFISTASFFAYLYHRPFWKILVSVFEPDNWKNEALFRLLPGSIIVLFVCYFLQIGYDRLLAMFSQKKILDEK
jgi:peptidoglycan/LPS O-acetylase OafA/YrhL